MGKCCSCKCFRASQPRYRKIMDKIFSISIEKKKGYKLQQSNVEKYHKKLEKIKKHVNKESKNLCDYVESNQNKLVKVGEYLKT